MALARVPPNGPRMQQRAIVDSIAHGTLNGALDLAAQNKKPRGEGGQCLSVT